MIVTLSFNITLNIDTGTLKQKTTNTGELNKMASIKERKNKNGETTSYQITVSLGRDQDGKKIFKTTSYTPKATTPGKAKKEVESFAVLYEKQVKDGTVITDGEKVTFSEFVDFWNDQYLSMRAASNDITQKCREDYLRILQLHACPAIGHIKLSAVKSVHIDSIIKTLIEEDKSPKTIRNIFNVIRAVFEYAYRKQIIVENPCNRCNPLPKVKAKKEIHYFTQEEVYRFLNEALEKEYPITFKEHTRTQDGKDGLKQIVTIKEYSERYSIPLQFKVFFTLAIYSGCRRAELCALTWNDINEKNHTITIKKSVSSSKEYGEQIKSPKTTAGERVITLPQSCFDQLAKWKAEQKQICLKLGTYWKGFRGNEYGMNYIFIQHDGQRMNVQTPTAKFRKILKAYNASVPFEKQLPLIRLHDLRHTNASHLVASGVDFETIAKRLGHSKASFTLDVYGHALPENDKKASDKLDQIFTARR